MIILCFLSWSSELEICMVMPVIIISISGTNIAIIPRSFRRSHKAFLHMLLLTVAWRQNDVGSMHSTSQTQNINNKWTERGKKLYFRSCFFPLLSHPFLCCFMFFKQAYKSVPPPSEGNDRKGKEARWAEEYKKTITKGITTKASGS